MTCDIGPIDHHPKIAQVEIDYGISGDSRPAFILTGDGKCLVDLPRLIAYAEMSKITQPLPSKDFNQAFENIRMQQNNMMTYLVRSVLSVLGHEMPYGKDEIPSIEVAP